MNLAGKVAVITGAGGGFGQAFCHSFLNSGVHVMALDVTNTGLEAMLSELPLGDQRSLKTKVVDISNFSQCQGAIEDAITAFGKIDILINNAGLGMGAIREDHHLKMVGIDEVAPEVWNHVIAVNLTGPWNMTKAAIPQLRLSEAGRIINITTSFFTMLRGNFHPYGPSKSGFEAMSAGHADEFRDEGITVNVIVPGGPANTPMVPVGSGFDRDLLVPAVKMTYPALWLCSAEAQGITGKRFVAGSWNPNSSLEENRRITEAPIGWPDLAQTPIWPGGKPD
tara:strand:+ start:4522 stop:5364 length:843 start_codon:yes stop_codon:yes gene_type:complete